MQVVGNHFDCDKTEQNVPSGRVGQGPGEACGVAPVPLNTACTSSMTIPEQGAVGNDIWGEIMLTLGKASQWKQVFDEFDGQRNGVDLTEGYIDAVFGLKGRHERPRRDMQKLRSTNKQTPNSSLTDKWPFGPTQTRGWEWAFGIMRLGHHIGNPPILASQNCTLGELAAWLWERKCRDVNTCPWLGKRHL